MLNFTTLLFNILSNSFVRDKFLDTRLVSFVETPLGTYQKISEVYRLKIDPSYVSIKPSTITLQLKTSAPELFNFLQGNLTSKVSLNIIINVQSFENDKGSFIFNELSSSLSFDLSISTNNCCILANKVSETNQITKNISGVNFYGESYTLRVSGFCKTCYECKDSINSLLSFNTQITTELNFNTLTGIFKATYLSI